MVRYGIGAGGIIDEDRAGLGGNIAVDDYIVAVSTDGYVARGIYRSVESRLAKVVEIVGQQVVGLYVEVVAQVC